MNVRAITVFAPVDQGQPDLRTAATISESVQNACDTLGYPVQTVRIALPPVDAYISGPDSDRRLLDLAHRLDTDAPNHGFGYVSLGMIDCLASNNARWPQTVDIVPTIIATTTRVAITTTVGRRFADRGEIHLEACRRAGEAVAAIARTGKDGFGNLRFGALANCSPHIPFFPAAYHSRRPGFAVALALECADVVEAAFTGAETLADARDRLVHALTSVVRTLANAVQTALDAHPDVHFAGVDFSPAPFPGAGRSIGASFEALGLPAFGGPGTVFVASFLTECLHAVARQTGMHGRTDAGTFRPFGFSGLMMPVLEDATLATRASEGHISIDRLLLASTVCGLGLDTVPLAGDTPASTLGAVILDMATLAVRLDKPLTARLFPVPGRNPGDSVSWDFPYFAPSTALSIQGEGPQGMVGRAGVHVMQFATG